MTSSAVMPYIRLMYSTTADFRTPWSSLTPLPRARVRVRGRVRGRVRVGVRVRSRVRVRVRVRVGDRYAPNAPIGQPCPLVSFDPKLCVIVGHH